MDLKINDYVFVSRWLDEDPHDPWYISFITEIKKDSGDLFKVQGTNRTWRHCRKITKEEGDEILATFPKLEML